MTETQKSPVKSSLILILGCIWSLIVVFLLIVPGQYLGLYLVNYVKDTLLPAHIVQSDAFITGHMYMLFIGIWILALLFLAIFPKNRQILKTLAGGMKGNNLKMLLVGIGLGFATNLACAFTAMLNGDIHLRFDSLQIIPFLLLFVLVFIQSAAEELVCRAYFYRKILSYGGKPWLAGILNSASFALLHIMNPGLSHLALLNLFLSGLFLSAMVIYMDSIWAAMGAHCAWNFCQNILLGLPNSGIVAPFSVFKLDAAAATNSFAYSVDFGLEGTIVASTVLAISTVLIWLWHRKFASVKTE